MKRLTRVERLDLLSAACAREVAGMNEDVSAREQLRPVRHVRVHVVGVAHAQKSQRARGARNVLPNVDVASLFGDVGGAGRGRHRRVLVPSRDWLWRVLWFFLVQGRSVFFVLFSSLGCGRRAVLSRGSPSTGWVLSVLRSPI